MQTAKLKDVVCLPTELSLPTAEMLAVRRRRFQEVLLNAIAGATYSAQPIISLRSHPEVEGSDTYSQDFKMHCRTVLDGKREDVPLNARVSIVNALRYQELHYVAGFFDFQLRRTACVTTLKCLCTLAGYPSPPLFQTCSALSIKWTQFLFSCMTPSMLMMGVS